MIFAMRKSGHHQTLVEFPDWPSFAAFRKDATGDVNRQVSMEFAFSWVKEGREHETGLYWIDDEIAYASPGSDP